MKITNNKGLPGVIVRAAEAIEYSGPKWYDWPKTISGTTLIAPPRIAALKRKHDGEISQDISDMVYALEGTALHKILEMGAKSGGLYEFRCQYIFNGSIVTAQLDAWEDEVLYDYKWTLSRPKPEWEQQLNVESLLLDYMNVKTKEIKVVAFRRGYIEVIPFKLWSPEERDSFIMERVQLHQLAAKELPECTAEETWGLRRCQKYCLVAPFCTQWLDKKQKET